MRLQAAHMAGEVPVFRVAERQRSLVELGGVWWPAEAVRLDARLDLRSDRLGTGDRITGPGDLRLATAVIPVRGVVDLGLGWQVKLPNADEHGGLGTDETDIGFWGEGSWERGPMELGAVVGLDILGHPMLLAEQDDVPVTWLTGVLDLDVVELNARVGGGWATARNPARLEAALGIEGRCPHRHGVELTAGLTPAAPDWGVRLWTGRAGACR